MEVKFNIPFFCPDNIAKYLQKVFDGEYDVPLTLARAKIIDLGANCGAFSLWALHRFPGAEIHAYEPHPETYEYLKKNTTNLVAIKTYNHGIGTPGLRLLCEGYNNCGEASFHQPANNPTSEGQHLDVKDPLTLPEADILKMDIEGCEVEVMEPLLAAGRKFSMILYEYHNHSLRERMHELLKEDYAYIGGEAYNVFGLGTAKWLRKELLP